ncbi:uncharacterized protein LOC110459367 [Mizuhopecten yessoensis]|uniref:uncharacterized protein LOC110459367 n=1 Tax=Mizuhopecten yessoensis TaxID=6573 RepID=UPI000B458267|nr:uncharacterized protein LOC110459367 [Mizuhopecten yessoensis]
MAIVPFTSGFGFGNELFARMKRTNAGKKERSVDVSPIPNAPRRQCSPKQKSSLGVVMAFSYMTPKTSCRAKQNIAFTRVIKPQFLPRLPIYKMSAVKTGPSDHMMVFPIPTNMVAMISREKTSANNRNSICDMMNEPIPIRITLDLGKVPMYLSERTPTRILTTMVVTGIRRTKVGL